MAQINILNLSYIKIICSTSILQIILLAISITLQIITINLFAKLDKKTIPIQTYLSFFSMHL